MSRRSGWFRDVVAINLNLRQKRADGSNNRFTPPGSTDSERVDRLTSKFGGDDALHGEFAFPEIMPHPFGIDPFAFA